MTYKLAGRLVRRNTARYRRIRSENQMPVKTVLMARPAERKVEGK